MKELVVTSLPPLSSFDATIGFRFLFIDTLKRTTALSWPCVHLICISATHSCVPGAVGTANGASDAPTHRTPAALGAQRCQKWGHVGGMVAAAGHSVPSLRAHPGAHSGGRLRLFGVASQVCKWLDVICVLDLNAINCGVRFLHCPLSVTVCLYVMFTSTANHASIHLQELSLTRPPMPWTTLLVTS